MRSALYITKTKPAWNHTGSAAATRAVVPIRPTEREETSESDEMIQGPHDTTQYMATYFSTDKATCCFYMVW